MWLEEDIDQAVKTLRKGGILLYPTDTVWGLGCDALNEASIGKIYKIKQREASKPFIVLMSDMDMLKQYVEDIHPRVETLLTLHERPLTIVYPNVKGLPEIVQSEGGKVAIRIARDRFCIQMINALGRPIISSSANVAGQAHPKGFGEISSSIIKKVDYVVKHRQGERYTGVPSVIAEYNYKGHLEFIRT